MVDAFERHHEVDDAVGKGQLAGVGDQLCLVAWRGIGGKIVANAEGLFQRLSVRGCSRPDIQTLLC